MEVNITHSKERNSQLFNYSVSDISELALREKFPTLNPMKISSTEDFVSSAELKIIYLLLDVEHLLKTKESPGKWIQRNSMEHW